MSISYSLYIYIYNHIYVCKNTIIYIYIRKTLEVSSVTLLYGCASLHRDLREDNPND